MLKSLSSMLSALHVQHDNWTWLPLKGAEDKEKPWTGKQPAFQLSDGKLFEPIGVICLPAKCEASQLCDNHFSCGVDCPFYEVAASCGSGPIADRDVNVVPCTCAVRRHQSCAACQRVFGHRRNDATLAGPACCCAAWHGGSQRGIGAATGAS